LLRDILKGEDRDIQSAVDVIAHISPDILLLTGFDWDHGMSTLGAFASLLGVAGTPYPHLYAARPNAGKASGLDLDGDGRLGGPRDAQGYGRFAGHGGMALLSRLPLVHDEVREFTDLRWKDFPGALLPETDAGPFPSAEALDAQLLSSVAHWDVPVIMEGGTRLHLLSFAAGPPVFDGPEDRNGRRNHDEVALWSHYLAGGLGQSAPDDLIVVLGNANLDPADGEGLQDAILDLLAHPRVQDARPHSAGGDEAAGAQRGANIGQSGDPNLDTADWSDDPGPGNLRVSYVLPDRQLSVIASGVFWPAAGDPMRQLIEGEGASRHRLVWVDIEVPD